MDIGNLERHLPSAHSFLAKLTYRQVHMEKCTMCNGDGIITHAFHWGPYYRFLAVLPCCQSLVHKACLQYHMLGTSFISNHCPYCDLTICRFENHAAPQVTQSAHGWVWDPTQYHYGFENMVAQASHQALPADGHPPVTHEVANMTTNEALPVQKKSLIVVLKVKYPPNPPKKSLIVVLKVKYPPKPSLVVVLKVSPAALGKLVEKM